MVMTLRVTESHMVRADRIEPDDIVSFDGGAVWNFVTEVNVIKSDAQPWSIVQIDYARPSFHARDGGQDPAVQPFARMETLSGMALVHRQYDKIVRVADM